ncbi:hypothetical protein OE88DRAFT_422270 [Heliocybe sulcata]|uniref:Uncharacterized protein n=1 Tax=Heliocybe sulcata TaxID=5364 RepID=A0A5C3MWJ7_9AGAM|nr:hypothetical protein OE88DRAFT_422270 [Heliocybe sulcata]
MSVTRASSRYEVSKAEATFYYAGISPSPPKLVYRTGGDRYPWVMPKGPEAYRRLEQACGVFGHKLNAIWNDVGPKVRDLLIAESVPWTSIDVVRFVTDGDGDEKVSGPVVIWVGVVPDSLDSDGAFDSSNGILELLATNDVDDVEVEYRESIYTPSVGPALLPSVSNLNATADVRGPLTTALGLFVATPDRQDAQGTMGLYFAEGGSSDKVLGLTCHHVLFKAGENTNDPNVLAGAGAPRKNVQLLGTRHFEKLLDDIKLRIRGHGIMLPIHEDQITKLKAKVKAMDEARNEAAAEEAGEELQETERLLQKTHKAIEDLEKFYDRVKREWGTPTQRIIGHIRSSPALTFNVGPEGFTEDWGAFELDGSKFKDAFKGNFIDLGTEIPPHEFTVKMYPGDDEQTTFKYPSDRLLGLRDIIAEERMCNPDLRDHDNETCLFVIKNGNATGVTIGRATGIFSFVRADLSSQGSKAWAIYNYDNKSGAFSARGDSGSIIVDGLGRIGGLLTGGAGKTETSDVTYRTPMFWLWPRIKQHFPHAHLYPTTMA